MKNKYILELYNEKDELESSEICKTYREISIKTNEAYHDCRAIHLMGNGSMKKKFIHPTLKKLQQRMIIKDIK